MNASQTATSLRFLASEHDGLNCDDKNLILRAADELDALLNCMRPTAPAGCVCPADAPALCKNQMCPRRNFKIGF